MRRDIIIYCQVARMHFNDICWGWRWCWTPGVLSTEYGGSWRYGRRPLVPVLALVSPWRATRGPGMDTKEYVSEPLKFSQSCCAAGIVVVRDGAVCVESLSLLEFLSPTFYNSILNHSCASLETVDTNFLWSNFFWRIPVCLCDGVTDNKVRDRC